MTDPGSRSRGARLLAVPLVAFLLCVNAFAVIEGIGALTNANTRAQAALFLGAPALPLVAAVARGLVVGHRRRASRRSALSSAFTWWCYGQVLVLLVAPLGVL